MIKLFDRTAISDALDDPDVDVDLRAAIGRRAWKLYVEQGRPVDEDIRIVVVEGGDVPDVINEALGFLVTGEHAEEPSFDWIEDHGLWFEIAYTRSDDIFTFVFVENNDSSDSGMHYLYWVRFWPAEAR